MIINLYNSSNFHEIENIKYAPETVVDFLFVYLSIYVTVFLYYDGVGGIKFWEGQGAFGGLFVD